MKWSHRRSEARVLLVAVLAMGSTVSWVVGAQTEEVQAQTEKPKQDTSGEAMPGSRTEPGRVLALPEARVAPRVLARPGGAPRISTVKPRIIGEGMAQALSAPQAVVRGDLLPVAQLRSVVQDKAPVTQLKPRLASGLESSESYLSIVMRVRSDGTSQVVSATEIPGPAPVSEEPKGDFLYEVQLGGRAVAVEALPDPFEAHAFGGPPGTPEALHHFERQEAATVVIKVPKAGLDSSLEDLSFQLFKLEGGAPLEKVNPQVLEQLKRSRYLRSLVRSAPQTLAPQIRELGLTLRPEALEIQK